MFTKYVVGGAVRDKFMGKVPKDIDYVYVGATHVDMVSLGYKIVGNDFPVYLDADGNEHALARRERKTGTGYNGFTFEFDADVTLEEDLARRDFTFNSMAMLVDDYNNDRLDKIIDPFGGRICIAEKRILATSDESFIEDPVRILRAARFACRYNFLIAMPTGRLIRSMISSDELKHLTPERVALEMNKALMEKNPSVFFTELNDVGALEILFPELHALIGQTQPEKYHAEGDSFIHTMMVLDLAAGVDHDLVTRFCALTHDLGKGLTPKHLLPHHKGHEAAGVPLVEAMCDRLKLSSDFKRAGAKVARFHMHLHKLHEMRDTTVLKIFEQMGRSHAIDFGILMDVAIADHHGRIRGDGEPIGQHPNAHNFLLIMQEIYDVRLSKLKTPEEIKVMTVNQIKDTIRREQLRVIRTKRKELYAS